MNDTDDDGEHVDGEDMDVTAERARALQTGAGAVFRVQRLRRVFYDGGFMCLPAKNVKVAVKDLSFCVGEGEVFGLLGPNGAGKTTTISILTGEITQTGAWPCLHAALMCCTADGDAQVQGKRVSDDVMSILLELGFCPQFSALWPNATTHETLRLFAVLKGFRGADIDRRVAFFLRQMRIGQYRDVWAEKLSGGAGCVLSACD